MLQVALGGYRNVDTDQIVYDSGPVFYEPGYNIMFPLELEVPSSDQIYILLRRRTDIYGNFDRLGDYDSFSVIVKDATTGRNVPVLLRWAKEYYSAWDPEGTIINPRDIVAIITNSIIITSPINRVRVLDIFIKDGENNFITFRLLVEDANKLFYYIPISVTDVRDRDESSSVGRTAIVPIKNNSDIYVLFSPFAALTEVDQSRSDFSYPLNTIFYKRQRIYNDEGFRFTIESYSHSFIEDCVSLINVPNYTKAAVLLIDKYLYTRLSQTSEPLSLSIGVNGILSDIRDTFTVKFRK